MAKDIRDEYQEDLKVQNEVVNKYLDENLAKVEKKLVTRIRILEREVMDIPGLVGPDSEVYKYRNFRTFMSTFNQEIKDFINEVRFKTNSMEAEGQTNLKDGLNRLDSQLRAYM